MDKQDGLRKRGKGFANVASIVRRELSKLTRIVGELEEKLVKMERRGTVDAQLLRQRRGKLERLSQLQRGLASRQKADETGITRKDHKRDVNKVNSTRGILQEQNQMLAQQDEALEDLSTGLSRLKNLGAAIGEEATLQTRLLEDLDEDVERGHNALARQTDHAALVRKRSGTCRPDHHNPPHCRSHSPSCQRRAKL